MSHQILRLYEVTDRTGIARSTIYARISDGSFPKPIKLGLRSVGWLENEINAWISDQICLSREGEGHE